MYEDQRRFENITLEFRGDGGIGTTMPGDEYPILDAAEIDRALPAGGRDWPDDIRMLFRQKYIHSYMSYTDRAAGLVEVAEQPGVRLAHEEFPAELFDLVQEEIRLQPGATWRADGDGDAHLDVLTDPHMDLLLTLGDRERGGALAASFAFRGAGGAFHKVRIPGRFGYSVENRGSHPARILRTQSAHRTVTGFRLSDEGYLLLPGHGQPSAVATEVEQYQSLRHENLLVPGVSARWRGVHKASGSYHTTMFPTHDLGAIGKLFSGDETLFPAAFAMHYSPAEVNAVHGGGVNFVGVTDPRCGLCAMAGCEQHTNKRQPGCRSCDDPHVRMNKLCAVHRREVDWQVMALLGGQILGAEDESPIYRLLREHGMLDAVEAMIRTSDAPPLSPRYTGYCHRSAKEQQLVRDWTRSSRAFVIDGDVTYSVLGARHVVAGFYPRAQDRALKKRRTEAMRTYHGDPADGHRHLNADWQGANLCCTFVYPPVLFARHSDPRDGVGNTFSDYSYGTVADMEAELPERTKVAREQLEWIRSSSLVANLDTLDDRYAVAILGDEVDCAEWVNAHRSRHQGSRNPNNARVGRYFAEKS